MGLLPCLMQFCQHSFPKVCTLKNLRKPVSAICAMALIGFGFSTLRSAAQSCPVNTPHLQGTWRTLPYLMPINPISATLLHTGKVLIVAGSENDASNNSSGSESYRNAIWDPTDPTGNGITVQEIEYDVFCSGTAALPDGRPLVIGGTSDYSFKGDNRASIFDPLTAQFVQSQSMVDGRWYGSPNKLSMLSSSGHWPTSLKRAAKDTRSRMRTVSSIAIRCSTTIPRSLRNASTSICSTRVDQDPTFTAQRPM